MTTELSADARRRRHNILADLEFSLRFVHPEIAAIPGYGEWVERTIGKLRDKVEAIPDDQLAIDDDERSWVDCFMPELHPSNFLLEQVVAAAEAAPRVAQRRRGKKGGSREKYDFDVQHAMTYLRLKRWKFQQAADLLHSEEGIALWDGRIVRALRSVAAPDGHTELTDEALTRYWRRAGRALKAGPPDLGKKSGPK
jgi:hypothetical protein